MHVLCLGNCRSYRQADLTCIAISPNTSTCKGRFLVGLTVRLLPLKFGLLSVPQECSSTALMRPIFSGEHDFRLWAWVCGKGGRKHGEYFPVGPHLAICAVSDMVQTFRVRNNARKQQPRNASGYIEDSPIIQRPGHRPSDRLIRMRASTNCSSNDAQRSLSRAIHCRACSLANARAQVAWSGSSHLRAVHGPSKSAPVWVVVPQ